MFEFEREDGARWSSPSCWALVVVESSAGGEVRPRLMDRPVQFFS